MPFAVAIPFFVLIMLAVGAAVYAGVVISKIMAAKRRFPSLADRLDAQEPQGGWPRLAVFVPAHNEADVIADVARSVLTQDYPRLRVVFALDRCTDDTEAVLRRAIADSDSPVAAEVVVITECPEGWAGKVHALHHAMWTSDAGRDAELLLFLDADCQLEPGCLKSAVTLQREHDVDLLSVLSSLIVEHWYERIVQPVAAFELVRQFPQHRVNADFGLPRDMSSGLLVGERRAWAFANGQFILVRRGAYEQVGGHECVKAALLEDIAIAKRFSRSGHRVGLFLSGGPLRCRMYRSWEAFGRGWKRIYTEAAKRRPYRLLGNARAVMATKVLLPMAGPACVLGGLVALLLGDEPLALACGIVGAAATVMYQRMVWMVYREQGLGMPMPWDMARGGWHVAAILRAARRDLLSGRATEWGGKRYARDVNDDRTPARNAEGRA